MLILQLVLKTFKEIQHSIAPDLARLNDIIARSLHSDSALMNSIVERYLEVKGKQLRPMMVLLSARLFGGVNEAVLHAGAAVEMLHNASLIHDDVLDDSRVRRGVATINGLWDNHVAVLVGDFFVSTALSCAVRTGDATIVKVMAQLGADLSLGEINQIDNVRQHITTEAGYFDVISRKTASLFTCCVEMGGIAAGATSHRLQGIKQFAHLLGLCFQIKDDTFDYYHDPAVGKPTGNDLREGKITLPLIHALSLEDRPERAAMLELACRPQLDAGEIETLVQWAKDCGGIDYAFATMRRLRDEAMTHLAGYPAGDTVEMLASIFDYIITRNK